MHLGAALTEEFSAAPQLTGVPVIVENDVNALAIHSYYERRLKGPSAALVVVFRKGVGGALILDGRPYRGSSGMAPEPGHLAVDYPKDPDGSRPPPGEASEGRTFDDECMCSTKDHKMYGHVDTLATPSRIEGHLAALKPDERTITQEQAAAAPRALLMEDRFVLTEEAQVLRRAGRALGRDLRTLSTSLTQGSSSFSCPVRLRDRRIKAAAPNIWMLPNLNSTAPTRPVRPTPVEEVSASPSTAMAMTNSPVMARWRQPRLPLAPLSSTPAASTAAPFSCTLAEHARGLANCRLDRMISVTYKMQATTSQSSFSPH